MPDGRPRLERLLGPYVEIMLATGDTAAAHIAAEEFGLVAAELGTPLLRAYAARAVGAVLLAEGDVKAALVELRRAFNELNAPALATTLPEPACSLPRHATHSATMMLLRWSRVRPVPHSSR